MQSSIEIVLRGIPDSDELRRHIEDEARKLGRIGDRILSCRVVIQALQRTKQRGATLAVGLSVTLQGTEVVVNREHGEDVRTALREAFEAAGLQIEDHAKRRGDGAHRARGETGSRSRPR